jgi:hypothetical protein
LPKKNGCFILREANRPAAPPEGTLHHYCISTAYLLKENEIKFVHVPFSCVSKLESYHVLVGNDKYEEFKTLESILKTIGVISNEIEHNESL